MNCSELCYRVYAKAIHAERGFIRHDLTFLHTSFTKKFCQKKVKKNRKLVVRVLCKLMLFGTSADSHKHTRDSDIEFFMMKRKTFLFHTTIYQLNRTNGMR